MVTTTLSPLWSSHFRMQKFLQLGHLIFVAIKTLPRAIQTQCLQKFSFVILQREKCQASHVSSTPTASILKCPHASLDHPLPYAFNTTTPIPLPHPSLSTTFPPPTFPSSNLYLLILLPSSSSPSNSPSTPHLPHVSSAPVSLRGYGLDQESCYHS